MSQYNVTHHRMLKDKSSYNEHSDHLRERYIFRTYTPNVLMQHMSGYKQHETMTTTMLNVYRIYCI